MKQTDVLIIGAGLTGLTLAYLLRNTDSEVVVVEARNRLGGRIHTVGGDDQNTIEMGATWLGPAHTKLKELLDALNIDVFEQRLGDKAIYEPSSMGPHQLVTLPSNQESSYRIRGGTMKVIHSLTSYLSDGQLYLNEPIQKIHQEDQGLRVTSRNMEFKAKQVVSTLPPKLLAESIQTEPSLPDELTSIMQQTHTWMGESIKFGFSFPQPFWLDESLSGTVFSNVGPVPEMYDHTNFEGDQFALKGFLNGSYFSVSREERKTMILNQLHKYYGSQADSYKKYYELVWTNEPFTYHPYDQHVLPHQNNGHKVYQNSVFGGKFHVAGAETSPASSGYMDGAVRSAFMTFERLKG